MLKITFLPDKKNIAVNKGTTALEALGRAGINIDTPCGGKGICGKLIVKFPFFAIYPFFNEFPEGESMGWEI